MPTEKGKRRMHGLMMKSHSFCNFSQHQDLLGSFFFLFYLLSFCARVGPTILFLWQIFLNILTQEFFSTQKIFWPFTMDFLIEEMTQIHQILKYK